MTKGNQWVVVFIIVVIFFAFYQIQKKKDNHRYIPEEYRDYNECEGRFGYC